MSSNSYFIYVRKSTESEDRQKLSLPAQEEALRTLATRRGVAIAGSPIRETMSAKRPGRPLFSKMLEDLRRGKARGILAWHLDRLARNPVDGGAIIWALDQGEVSEIITPDIVYTATPDDKLMMSIVFGMATKYSDDLGRNIRRGNHQALQQGLWPARPRLGYVRDRNTMKLIPDPERFDLVKEIWKLALQGQPVRGILERSRNEWFLRTPQHGRYGGRLLSVSQLYRLLRDPFYAGIMVYGKEPYRGSHPALITLAEFDQVQKRLSGRCTNVPRPKRYEFTYRGLLNCGACGAMVTAERKTQRHGHSYVYYHCCRKDRRYTYCPEGSVEEGKIESAVVSFLDTLRLPDDLVSVVLDELERYRKTGDAVLEATRAQLQDEQRRLEGRLGRLKDLCLDGVIPKGEYAESRKDVEMNILLVKEETDRLQSVDRVIEPVKKSILFANQAVTGYEQGDMHARRRIILAMTSNLTLRGKKVLIQAKEPFAYYRTLRECPSVCTNWTNVRTLLEKELLGFQDTVSAPGTDARLILPRVSSLPDYG